MCAAKTDAERVEWSRRYRMAMRRFLRLGKSGSLLPAGRLGRRAVTLGLETLDVVRTHEQALAALTLADGPSGDAQEMTDRATVFFTEAIVPIEGTHRAGLQADARVKQLTRTLRRRTQATSAKRMQLERGIAERQAAESTLKKSRTRQAGLMAKARGLETQLQLLTREILLKQEEKRRKTSHQLRDEIAQTLLAINVRLLTLRKASKTKTVALKKEIAETQQLVKKCERGVRRLFQACEDDHET